MTAHNRITLNVLATYGRSVAGLLCGLFTARWVLDGLGPVEYGLLGVIVGMAGFVSVVISVLASALVRFYAVALGNAGAPDGVRSWFSAGVVVLVGIGTMLSAVGWPVGEYAIRHWLTIPPASVGDCLWVWRWNCLGCWVGMVVAPWQAMYAAKQRFVALSGYAFAALLANVGLAAWVMMHPGRRLVVYAAGLVLIGIIQNGVLLVRAGRLFEECRFNGWSGLGARAAELMRYAVLNSVQAIGWILNYNGMMMLVNKLCGPVVNGALAISNSIKTHSSQLSCAVQSAFSPIVATAFGAGDFEGVRRLALRVSKLAVISVLLFAMPLAVVLREVLELWLKNPPNGTWELGLLALVVLQVDAFGAGSRAAVYASGKLERFTAYGESVLLLTLPVVGVLWWLGWGVWAIGAAPLMITAANVGARLYFAQQLLGVSIRAWARKVVLPALGLILVGGVVGLFVRSRLTSVGMRIVVTVGVMEVVLVSLAWLLVFNRDERMWVKNRLRNLYGICKWRI